MSKDPRKWFVAAVLAVIFAVSFPTVYYRQKPETIVPQISLISLIKRVEPSVVYIEALDKYSGHLWSGSGVIISSDGLILTAGHIINGTEAFKIILSDGQEFLTGKSFLSNIVDVGLIQINVEKLPVSFLGNSDNLCKGKEVFMISSPFGRDLYNTVTWGIISGLERDIGFFGEKLIIQSDVQSWPGSSGGPVYDMNGHIIGILVGGCRNVSGISLIIPSNICKLVIDTYKIEKELENVR